MKNELKFAILLYKKSLKEMLKSSYILPFIIIRIVSSLLSFLFVIGVYSSNLKFEGYTMQEAILFQLFSMVILNSEIIKINLEKEKYDVLKGTIYTKLIYPVNLPSNYILPGIGFLTLQPILLLTTIIYSFAIKIPVIKLVIYLFLSMLIFNVFNFSIELIAFSLELSHFGLSKIIKNLQINLSTFGRYPKTILGNFLSNLFTFFIPLMIIANAPYQAIIENSTKLLIISSISVFSLFLFSIMIYKIAIKKFSSS